MTAPLYAIGRFCSRHHYPTIALWLIAAVALVVAGQASGDKTNDNLTLPGTDSTKATELLEDDLPQQAYGSNPLAFEAREGSLTEPKYAATIEKAVKRLESMHEVNSAVSPLTPAGASFLSQDKRVAYIPVVLGVSPAELTEEQAEAVLAAADPAAAAGLKTSVGGYVGSQLSKPDTGVSDAIGIAAAIVILLFAFGTATAMVMPIASAVIGLACALSIIRLLENSIQVPSVASTLATMIGLGVGIDYALFIVTRHKLQLGEGMELRESIARATATAGGAVVFAGFTVVIALCSLAFAGIPLVSTLGVTAAIAVVIAVLAAATLLPAMLGALGPHINSLRVQIGKTHPDGQEEARGWTRWAQGVANRPWRSVIAALLVLVVLAIPIFQLELGQNDLSALPKSTTARQNYDSLTQGFGPGVNGPLLIAAKFQTAEEAKLSLPVIEKQVAAAPDVAAVSPATLDKQGTVAVFTAISKSAPWADETVSLVEELRETTIPTAVKKSGGAAYVGGQTAGYIDLATQIADKLPLMIGIVVALSFIVLLLAFRSLLVPVKAAAMNLLSVAAAYGVVTAVFQLGWGSSLIGLDHSIPIVSFVPLLMFAILFGLSMDYEVFLLTQMREHYRKHGDEKQAVVEGLANTGRVITSAAAIMVCVFTSFVLNGNPVVKEFGVGLAIAIAIDSTLVRCLLVPAVMVLLGRRAWWLPRWLDRILPHISIEGEDYFAARDAKNAADGPKTGDIDPFEARRPLEGGD
jgi:RND superfamily putative drug exporter